MSVHLDRLDRLYGVADDYEAATLDELKERAGLTWTCRQVHPPDQADAWTNEVGEPCEICGKAQPRA